jgi:hypothetical protein
LNIHHEAVPVPSGSSPFDQQQLSLFKRGLKILTDSGNLPPGFGVTPDELGADGFDEQEEINIGLRKRGYLIELPSQVWKPRADLWAQGLYAMNAILASTA